MKDIHNSPLFTEITPEEEVTVQGGWLQIVGAAAAIGAGGRTFWNWARRSGNGFILDDRKNSWADKGRIGDVPQDLPNGWRWGIRDGGRWIVGGHGHSGNWLLDQAKRLVGL